MDGTPVLFSRWLRWSLIGVAMLLTPASLVRGQCTPPPSGLVAWYPGEGNADDIAGSGLNGSLQGGAAFAPAKVGLGFRFVSGGDFVQIPDPGNDFDFTGSFTIVAWVRLESGLGLSPDEVSPIIHRSAGSAGWELNGTRDLNDKRPDMVICASGGGCDRGVANGDAPFDTFIHLAGGYDGSVVFLYVNGVLQMNPETSVGPESMPGAPLYLARNPGVASRFFPGVIDEVQIYDRALSGQEIQDLFNADSFGTCSICGNGVLDGFEECDGTNLRGETCSSLGLESGSLSCSSSCTFDTSGCTGAVFNSPPATIRYQARLTDQAGVPLAGMHDLSFAIYGQESGGSALWSEGPRMVNLDDGSVELLLGEVTPLTSAVVTAPDRWLEVTVDASVLVPRQKLASVPFALVADRLGTKTLAQVEGRVDSSVGAHAIAPDSHPSLEESAEIDADVSAHGADADAHHTKTIDASELTVGTLDPARLGDAGAWSLVHFAEVGLPSPSGTLDSVVLPAGTLGVRDRLKIVVTCLQPTCGNLTIRIRPDADCGGVPCFGDHTTSCAGLFSETTIVSVSKDATAAENDSRALSWMICDGTGESADRSIFNFPSGWITTDVLVRISTPAENNFGDGLLLRWWIYRVRG